MTLPPALVLAALAATLLTSCGDRSASAATEDAPATAVTDSAPPRPLDVQAALARQGNLELRLTATGLLRAEATSVSGSEPLPGTERPPASSRTETSACASVPSVTACTW